MRVTIDRSGCIRCGSCRTRCPGVFQQNPEDTSSEITERYRVNDNPAEDGGDLADRAVEAADSCPVTVIFVEG